MSTVFLRFPELFASVFYFFAQKIRPAAPSGFFHFVYSAE